MPGRVLASPAWVWEREREGLPMSPPKPPQLESHGIWGASLHRDARLVSLSIPAELGGRWHPGIPLPLPVGPVGSLCPAPGWDLSLEGGESRGLCPLHLQPGPRWEAACTH